MASRPILQQILTKEFQTQLVFHNQTILSKEKTLNMLGRSNLETIDHYGPRSDKMIPILVNQCPMPMINKLPCLLHV